MRSERLSPTVVGTGLLVVASLAFLAWVALGVGGASTSLYVDDWATVAAAGLGAGLCWRAARTHTGDLRRFWALIAVGMTFWAIGELIWGLYDISSEGNVPNPSWADVAYLGALPAVMLALLLHPAVRNRPTALTRSLIDGLVVATACLVLGWTLIFEPAKKTTDLTSLGGLVTFAYPVSDIVIVVLIFLVIKGTTRADRASLWFLLGGLLAIAFSDAIYSYLADVKNYSSGNAMDTGWFLGYLAIALAAWSSSPRGEPAPAAHDRSLSTAALIAPFGPMLAALGVVAARVETGYRFDNVTRTLAFSLVGLVLLRQALLMYDLLTARRGEAPVSERIFTALGGQLEEAESSG